MKTRATATILVLIAAFSLQAWAEEGAEREKKGPPCGELREAHQATMQARREHFKEQRESNRAFHESLKDLEPDAKIDAILKQRVAQHKENRQFHQELYNSAVAAINACEHLSAEKKQEILAKLEEHHQEAQAAHDKMHAETVAFLKELKASDKTPEEKREALEQFRKEMREKMEARSEEHRPRGRHGDRDRGDRDRGDRDRGDRDRGDRDRGDRDRGDRDRGEDGV